MADQNAFDWQGHRGARGLMPENTIPAFLKALEYPVKTLELDICVSKDSQIIISHEPWFSHHICSQPDGSPVNEETGKSLLIYNMTYEEVKQYDCGLRGNERFPRQQKMKAYKPSLPDMVRAVEAYCEEKEREKPWYDIELKSNPLGYDTIVPNPQRFVGITLKELKALGILDRCNLQSFDVNVLKEINVQAPGLSTSFLVENEDGFEKNMALLDYTPAIYSPYFLFVDSVLVRQVHAKNMKLIPWTVNDVENMKALIALGVDGIITDYPDLIAEAERE